MCSLQRQVASFFLCKTFLSFGLQEIQQICANVVERNACRESLAAKKRGFESWRQIVEIALTACPDDLLQGESRQNVIFELLQDLLLKVFLSYSYQHPIILQYSIPVTNPINLFVDHFVTKIRRVFPVTCCPSSY